MAISTYPASLHRTGLLKQADIFSQFSEIAVENVDEVLGADVERYVADVELTV